MKTLVIIIPKDIKGSEKVSYKNVIDLIKKYVGMRMIDKDESISGPAIILNSTLFDEDKENMSNLFTHVGLIFVEFTDDDDECTRKDYLDLILK